ncbi:MAG TPA: PadR family transcriptional regulator [Mycobacteriales bacterium]|nr:PadR family transcriptional regulator [Mycobacteriales bacterium]
MPIQHAVLGLLEDGPSYGYELKAKFEAAIGPQWGRLNIGHLYQTLDRLERDGLVSSERVVADTRPDRRMFTLSAVGRTELAEWLEQPAERNNGYRDELFFKLLVAARQGTAAVTGVVSRQRAYQLAQLRTLADLRESHADDALVQLLIDAARLHNEADLKLLDLAHAARARLAAAGQSDRASHSESAGESAGALSTRKARYSRSAASAR